MAAASQPQQQPPQRKPPKEQKPPAAAKRRPNRPGFNSYLKVMLDDTTMDRLHGVAKRIQTLVQELDKKETKVDVDDSNNAKSKESPDEPQSTNEKDQEVKPKKKKGKKPPNFKPRSRASLHMTFFFGGEYLCELPQEELLDWHGKVKDRLAQSNFLLASATEEGGNDYEEDAQHNTIIDEYYFDVTDVRLFPPGRNNLVVAHLEAAPAWHALHNDIRDVARNSSSEGLKEVMAYGKEKWTAHITMGNTLGGGTKAQAKKTFNEVLEQVMKELREEHRKERDIESSSHECLFKARTHGIAMGGPVPEQVELDWDFAYKPMKKESSR